MQATASRSRSLARLAPAPERFHAAELCVRNLATETTAEDVRLAFAELGDVMGIRLQTDKKTGRGRAFVALDADEADAIRIILDGSTLGGSVITVDAAAPAKVKGAPSRASGGVSAARLNGVSAARLNDRLVSASSAADVLGVAVGVGDRDCINLATALHRVGALAGTLQASDGPHLGSLMARAAESLAAGRWSPRHLANAAWAAATVFGKVFGKVEIVEASSVEAAVLEAVLKGASLRAKSVEKASESSFDVSALLDAVAAEALKKMAALNAQDLANTAWAFAKAGHAQRPLFDAIALETPKKVEAFSAQNLANTAWAFATAGFEAPALFAAIAAEASKKIGTFKPQELANTVWAFSKAGFDAPSLYGAVATEALQKLPAFNAQALANTAWAFASAGFEALALFEAIAAEAPRQMRAFKGQGLANLVWALSTAHVSAPALYDAVAREAVSRIAAFNAQDLSNTAWAFATAGVEAPLLFGAVARASSKKAETCTSQQLSNTVWAFSKAGFPAPNLFQAVAVAAPKKMATFNAQALSNTAWAYATAGFAAPAIFQAVAVQGREQIATFNAQDLANTAWAFAKARVSAPLFFQAVAAQALEKMATFEPQNLANTVWAFAKAGVAAPLLFEAVAATSVEAFNSQDLANTAWAFTTAGFAAPLLFDAIALSIEARMGELDDLQLSQLHWVAVHLRLEWPKHALTLLLNRHASKLRSAFLLGDASPSQAQSEVSASLRRVGWAHEFEHVTADGLRLDMAKPFEKLAVEFDGPTHYYAGETRLDGPSVAKAWLLQRLGWRLVRVPFFEWGALSSPADQDEYLRHQIGRIDRLDGEQPRGNDRIPQPARPLSRI